VAQHASRQYSFSGQVLGSISLLMHFEALMILSCNPFIFWIFFYTITVCFTNLQKKNPEESNLGNEGARE
jgi:hypothetical protein